MSFVYRTVDAVLSANGEVREGDRLLIETGRPPRVDELALVRRGKAETLRRWTGPEDALEVLGVVIGIRRRL
ncbi:MAG: hypothetical protein JW876_04565 [Candidatus Krumholzibacteriota bacterium]|nr:hypothetical protein [Candidatus Krumholzibacteriota bacterium]